MKLNQLNWGIIGCGDVTEVKSGPAFNKVKNSSLVAVMRRNADKAADYANRHNVPKWYSDATELIQDKDVNAIYIATPPDSHAQYAIQAMQAGKPVYVEKPMAKSYAECLEMIKVSEQTGVPLFVAYYRRTLPAFLKVKELIDENAIGKILTVNLKLYKQPTEQGIPKEEQHWHVNPKIAGAGHLFDLASHQFDYLDFLFGPISEVKGIATNRAGYYEAEDTVSASFAFKSGIIGSGTWCFVVDKHSEKDIIEINGTKGKITIPCFIHGSVKLQTENKIKEYNFKNPDNISHNLIEQVVDELLGNGKCISTMHSAARTSWVLDEIVKDYYSNKKK